jgi:hypothetical protein
MPRHVAQDRRAFLEYAAKGCGRFELNRSTWALESEVKQIGGETWLRFRVHAADALFVVSPLGQGHGRRTQIGVLRGEDC